MSASRLAAWRRPCGRFLLAPTKHTCVGFTCSLLRQEGCLLRFSAEDLPQGQLLLGGAEKESGGRVKDSAAVPGPARPGHGHGGEQCFLLPGWQTGADQDGAPAQEDTGPPQPPEWGPRQMEQREGASSAEIASEGFTVRVP